MILFVLSAETVNKVEGIPLEEIRKVEMIDVGPSVDVKKDMPLDDGTRIAAATSELQPTFGSKSVISNKKCAEGYVLIYGICKCVKCK
ncbi:unnamed protein product [Colias eurytheme]|nr:unnamed protein product [Colias eurytheme]